jgi:hypothetical protein
VALWHAAALFVGAAVAERVTRTSSGPVHEQPWFRAASRKPAQFVSDHELVFGEKKSLG